MLELQNVTKEYYSHRFKRSKIKAADNVSLSIPQGKTVGLVGESGSGKTTIGLLATGLLVPDSGDIILEGRSIHSYNKAMKKGMKTQVQVIFQSNESCLDPRMTAITLIKEPLIVNKKDCSDEVVYHLMKTVGISKDLAYRYPHELSGGQRQRICIARAISLNPSYIIADEPAASLDYSVQAQILELLLKLQKEQNIGILFISHHLKIIHRIADEIAVMYKGKIIERGPKKKIFDTPLHPYTQTLMASLPGIHRRSVCNTVPQSHFNGHNTSSGCSYYHSCPGNNEVCRLHEPETYEADDLHLVRCHNHNLNK